MSWPSLLPPHKQFDPLSLNRRNIEAAVPDSEDQLVLTKGDNNPVDDIGLYRGLKYLERKHVVGKVRGYVSTPSVCGYYLARISRFLPYVGYVTIAMVNLNML